MSNLVERLRSDVQTEDCDCERCALFREAADRIAELERQLAEHRAQPTAQQVEDARERVARAIWNIRREDEDRCDMELEDMGSDHSVWREADAAIATISAQEQVEPTDAEIAEHLAKHIDCWHEIENEDRGDIFDAVRALLSANQGKKS